MKRILTIQDISCVGKCSLTVALPILSALGLETCILPTAVLSTHTGFKNFTFCDLTDEIEKITAAWKAENIEFDGIYTGFLGSFRQLELIKKLISEFADKSVDKNRQKLVLIDPCMGDNGKFYSCFDIEFAMAMREFCKVADIITPNITEACFLTATAYPKYGYNELFIRNLLDKLACIGVSNIVLKGVSYDDRTCGVLGYDVKNGVVDSYFHELLPAKFSGTGDMFASVTFGKMMRNSSLKEAIKMAADFVVDAIKMTLVRENRAWYGVDFEVMLPRLMR